MGGQKAKDSRICYHRWCGEEKIFSKDIRYLIFHVIILDKCNINLISLFFYVSLGWFPFTTINEGCQLDVFVWMNCQEFYIWSLLEKKKIFELAEVRPPKPRIKKAGHCHENAFFIIRL